MPGNYTEQGIRNIKQAANLCQAAEQWTASQGGRVVTNYMTVGSCDFVIIVELPSLEVALEGGVALGQSGRSAHPDTAGLPDRSGRVHRPAPALRAELPT